MSVAKLVIFVSHSGTDAWVARQIGKAIEDCGAQPFLSEQLEAGVQFDEEIRNVLRKAREVLAYLTPWALDRPWVWMEMGAAWVLKRRLVCVLHGLTPGQLRSDPRFPVAIARLNFVDVNEIEAGYLSQLRQRIKQSSGGSART